MHRNLALENIFLGPNLEVKLGDFGHAFAFAPRDERRHSICGNIHFRPPEMVNKNFDEERVGHYLPADVWAFGVVMYSILVGEPPFKGRDDEKICDKIVHGTYKCPQYLSQEAKLLIDGCLKHNPQYRPSME